MKPNIPQVINASINSDEIITVTSDETTSLIPKTKAKKTKLIIVPVYLTGVGQIFIAVLLQSAAAYVMGFRIVRNVPLATAVGISSQLAKSAFLINQTLPELKKMTKIIHECLMSAAWWKGFLSNIKQRNFSKRGIAIYALKILNILSGLVPGIFFGFANIPIAKDFRELVKEVQPGAVFDMLADWSDEKAFMVILILTSVGSNLIATQAMNYYVCLLIKKYREEWRELRTQGICYKKKRFIWGIIVGSILSGVTIGGFFSFLPFGVEVGQEHMGMPLLAAQIFSGTVFAYMAELSFITALPLGKEATENAMDVITSHFKYPTARKIALSLCLFALTLAIITMDALSTVWQAEYAEHYTSIAAEIFEDVVSLFAAAITEYASVYEVLLLLPIAASMLVAYLKGNCFRSANDKDIAEPVIMQPTEQNINKWQKPSNSKWTIKNCRRFLLICSDTESEDYVAHARETEPFVRQQP